MHLLRIDSRSLDEAEAAADLGQTPAGILFLSYSDSDLSLVAETARQRPPGAMSLRLANLAWLKHPYSVDLYLEKTVGHARFVLVRLLGGLDYWRYGIEELARAARSKGFAFAAVPGDSTEDERLDAASTVPIADLRRIHAAFQMGGVEHVGAVLAFAESFEREAPVWRALPPASAAPSAGRYEGGCRRAEPCLGKALIVFYRSYLLAGDTAAIEALADVLAARGLSVTAVFVASLKETEAIAWLREELSRCRPDIIVNTTGFSARLEDESSVLDEARVPVLQAILSSAEEAQWRNNPRGLGAADLAMNAVLPELDGRLITRAFAFKEEASRRADLEFAPRVHAPLPSRTEFVASLAASWVILRRTPRARRKIACILPDYPGRQGRGGYAVGLDTAGSAAEIARILQEAGYSVTPLPRAESMMRRLEEGAGAALFPLSSYLRAFDDMPAAFAGQVRAQWGDPRDAAEGGAFVFPVIRAGNLLIALQPDRGNRETRKADYHDAALAPCHAYIAFYAWLRECEKVHAIIHCGTHGTLEWLPGKAVALDRSCAPEAVLGPLPVIYPFIVNNPGEAAQAKRRICALTISHLTPPLIHAGHHGAALELETLFDEYAAAEALDPKRAKRLAKAILTRARETGLFHECGLNEDAAPADALRQLDGWLCDVKEMRIADGLHIFGRPPEGGLAAAAAAILGAAGAADGGEEAVQRIGRLMGSCGPAERAALLEALDGGFVPPGPGGAPSRGRIDVLPTGRNLYGTDPRAVPSRTAWETGRAAAQEVLTRYLQDHGEWPKRIVMDLWASAAMRTGGEDLAQALALLGVRPLWDNASARVTGFEIIPCASLGRPRVDVTLRISGLFRDVFPAQVTLFGQAVRAVGALDEDDEHNPLAAAQRCSGEAPLRIFGTAPGVYGIGLAEAIDANPMLPAEALAARYLASASHAYCGALAEGIPSRNFAGRVATADAFVHSQDQDEGDVLDSSETADHEGGFAAAARLLGNEVTLYHANTARPASVKVRTLKEEIARVVRGRAANPRWIAGQMRHGHRGAAEIAAAADNLYAFAVLSEAVGSQHFDLLFGATLGKPEVREFLMSANPRAARALAKCFENARARGFWQTRSNSALAVLAAFTQGEQA
ncbi:MAG TPA: cobaltochelatase subunit CobN [Methylocella sp.]|nr:cobaltochelatase subunit CobN [Methylocella sp.]